MPNCTNIVTIFYASLIMTNQTIKLIVGLGNPGTEYQDTRHNVGFWCVDFIAEQNSCRLSQETKFHGICGRCSVNSLDLRLLKPLTYVNRSGQAVVAIANYFEILPSQILVIHDELDIPCGQVRLKLGGGSAGHNGLSSIINALSGKEFWRIRIGINRPSERNQVVDYVLNRPTVVQIQSIETTIKKVATCLPEIIIGNFNQAMNYLHSKI